jgi:hypothetical protein
MLLMFSIGNASQVPAPLLLRGERGLEWMHRGPLAA